VGEGELDRYEGRVAVGLNGQFSEGDISLATAETLVDSYPVVLSTEVCEIGSLADPSQLTSGDFSGQLNAIASFYPNPGWVKPGTASPCGGCGEDYQGRCAYGQ
jgi:hypothetical protein